MRRLLACLLALMLPCCALAETYAINWTADVSADGLSMLLDLSEESLGSDTPFLSARQIAALAEMLSGLSATFYVNESGDRLKLVMSYQDEELIEFDGQSTEDAALCATNILKDMLLTMPIDPALNDAQAAAEQAWENQPWIDLCKRYTLFADVWEASIDASIEYGAFAGDAYSGGKRSWTYRFDERDIAVLLESIVTAELSDNLAALLTYYGLTQFDNPDGLTDFLYKRVHDASLRNQYRYVLRIVDDGSDDPELVGISLLIYEKDRLIATISMGGDENVTNMVLGYGIHGINCYLALTQTDDPTDGPNLLAKFWRDTNKAGYYAASSNEDNLLLSTELYVEASDSALSLRTKAIGAATQNTPVEAVLTVVDTPDFGDITLSVKLADQQLMTSSLTFSYAEDMPDMERDGLLVIDITDTSAEDERTIADALNESAGELAVKLFRLLPPEILTIFMMLPLF